MKKQLLLLLLVFLAVLALPAQLVAVAVHVVAEMVANDRRGY